MIDLLLWWTGLGSVVAFGVGHAIRRMSSDRPRAVMPRRWDE